MNAVAVDAKERAEHHVDRSQPTAADQHKHTSPEVLDGSNGHKGKDHHDNTRDQNVYQHAGQPISSRREHLLCVVEDDVDAAPLLQRREDDADQHDSEERLAHQLGEFVAGLVTVVVEAFFNFREDSGRVGRTTDAREVTSRLVCAATLHQPAGTLRHCKHADEE